MSHRQVQSTHSLAGHSLTIDEEVLQQVHCTKIDAVPRNLRGESSWRAQEALTHEKHLLLVIPPDAAVHNFVPNLAFDGAQ